MKKSTSELEEYKKESEMFNLAADYYDKFRPSYQQEIIRELIDKTGITKGSELLEIGAGSGKATQLLKDKGFNICCIDPGKDLVAKGILNFKNYPNIKYKCTRFEEYDVKENFYDVIFSAQSFHWVPQPAGFIKCASALKENGFLAPFWNMYITYDNDVDNELCEISKRYGGLAFINKFRIEV
jgi:2-polyprenyl-3-methyl-5-hydroxy-6-metoxy-1,4-benzoquinol methylase